MMNNTYQGIKSGFASRFVPYREAIQAGIEPRLVADGLRTTATALARLDVLMERNGQFIWNPVFADALAQRAACERLLADGATPGEVADYLHERGYSLSQVAAAFEKLFLIGSGVALHFVQLRITAATAAGGESA